MIEYIGYKNFLTDNFGWVIRAKDFYIKQGTLLDYDPSLYEIEQEFENFQQVNQNIDLSIYEEWIDSLNSRVAFLSVIHSDYGKILYHNGAPYESLRNISLIPEANLFDTQYKEQYEESEFMMEQLRHNPMADIIYIDRRYRAYLKEAEANARAFLCAGFIEEQHKTQILLKALKMKNW